MRKQACEEVEASYGLVETLFEEMAEFTVRLTEYAKVEVGDVMRKKVVATLAWLVYVIVGVVYRGNWLTVHSMLEIIGRSEELIRTKRFSMSSICLFFVVENQPRDTKEEAGFRRAVKSRIEIDSDDITGHFIGVAWVGRDEKTRDALDRFRKLIDSEERLVVAITYSSVQNTEQNVNMLLSAANDNKQSQEEMLEKVDELSTVVTSKLQFPLWFKTKFL